jgi:hypothetical protein
MPGRELSLNPGLWARARDTLRRWRVGRSTEARAQEPVKKKGSPVMHDAQRLECIAAYARAGYFDAGYAANLSVVTSEIPLNDPRE